MNRAFQPFAGPRFALARVRLTCRQGDRGSLEVRSTCGATQKLEATTDEDLAFSDNDLIVIKNVRHDPCELKFRALELPDGRRAIFRPSRQGSQTIYDARVSELRAECTVKLGGGESLTIVTSEWIAGRGQGAGKLVVV